MDHADSLAPGCHRHTSCHPNTLRGACWPDDERSLVALRLFRAQFCACCLFAQWPRWWKRKDQIYVEDVERALAPIPSGSGGRTRRPPSPRPPSAAAAAAPAAPPAGRSGSSGGAAAAAAGKRSSSSTAKRGGGGGDGVRALLRSEPLSGRVFVFALLPPHRSRDWLMPTTKK